MDSVVTVMASARVEQSPGSRGLFGATCQRLDVTVCVARTLDGKAHLAVDQREQRVVLAHADVGAGMELGAALAHDDRAGRTIWPPNTFTPSILGWESRPLRVEPPPFFCAMLQLLTLAAISRVDRADLQISVNCWRWPWRFW